MPEVPQEADAPDPDLARALDLIAKALRGLRFGEVNVIVQDGVVVQLDRTERTRLRRSRR